MSLRIAAMTTDHWPEVADTYRQALAAGRLHIFNTDQGVPPSASVWTDVDKPWTTSSSFAKQAHSANAYGAVSSTPSCATDTVQEEQLERLSDARPLYSFSGRSLL